jgi:1,4-dihydroxy-2-naphthoyl-CoA hydrolase
MSVADPTALIRSAMPLCETLGMRAAAAGPDEVVVALDWAEGLCTSGGALHGGILMALADSAGATCAYLNLPEGASGTTTLESKTNFFAAATAGKMRAESSALHKGKRTHVWQTRVVDAHGRLLSLTIQTQMIL